MFTLFLAMYIMTAITIRFEYNELSRPFGELLRHFERIRDVPQKERLNNYLSGAARSINCSGIIIVKFSQGGVYYFAENVVRFGEVTKEVAIKLSEFLNERREKLESLSLTRPSDINQHSAIIREIELLINPPIKNGITAAVAVPVPQDDDVYFIALNPLSRNGTMRSQFWITHVAVIKMLALGVGVSLNPFVETQNLEKTEAASVGLEGA